MYDHSSAGFPGVYAGVSRLASCCIARDCVRPVSGALNKGARPKSTGIGCEWLTSPQVRVLPLVRCRVAPCVVLPHEQRQSHEEWPVHLPRSFSTMAREPKVCPGWWRMVVRTYHSIDRAYGSACNAVIARPRDWCLLSQSSSAQTFIGDVTRVWTLATSSRTPARQKGDTEWCERRES